jgi:UDPglucose--hexose-1-phosphate uridylyltransferase
VTEIRRNPITGEPLLFAPHRASRAGAFGERIQRCPFCPGHEDDTPPEIERIGEPWRLRVVPNKYPPSDGAEVIIESSRHDARFHQIERPSEAVDLLLRRMRSHANAAHVAAFRNEGREGGASIPHLHSQVVPLPFVPPRIVREIEGFRGSRDCPLCRPFERDLIIDENDSFLRIAPWASFMPYQQWIVPRRHMGSLTRLAPDEIERLAQMFVAASASMAAISDSNNWTLLTYPTDDAHAYVEIFPRLTKLAGLELGAGTFVEIIDPASAARRLRN